MKMKDFVLDTSLAFSTAVLLAFIWWKTSLDVTFAIKFNL